MKRRKVVVLGAGGLVAQRLQQRLLHHPWFELAAVAGSARYLHQPLRSVPWGLEEPRPEFPNIIVEDISDASTIESMVQKGITVAFSALPSQKAKTIEPMWSAAGIAVFSNASAFRGVAGIPLVVPEINAGELEKPLFHACATNCTLLPLLLPCAALHASFGLAAYTMRSEQGLSGGGFDYMNDALTKGQVDASIPGEAEKTEQEFRHVLGWKGHANLDCGRVMRPDGHHVFVTATLEEAVTESDVVASLNAWSNSHQLTHLPSGPHQPLMLVDSIEVDNHLFADGLHHGLNPDFTVDLKAGMAITVGSVRCVDEHTVQFEAYSHNTLRGAAGGVVYLAELAAYKELI